MLKPLLFAALIALPVSAVPPEKSPAKPARAKALAQANYRVRTTRQCGVGYPVKLDKELDKRRNCGGQAGVSMRKGFEDKGTLCHTGRQWLAAKSKGLSANSTMDMVAEGFIAIPTDTALFLASAKPSQKSFLSHFRMASVKPGDLPGAMGLMEGDAIREANEKSLSLAQTCPDAKVVCDWTKPKGRHGRDIAEIDANGEKIILTALAFGDFNGDGIEDVLVEEYHRIIEGTFFWQDVAVFTRRTKGGQPERIEVDPMGVWKKMGKGK